MKTQKQKSTVKLSDFIENPDNPSTATDEEIRRLAGKLKRVPLGLTAMRIAYVTDRTDAGLAGKRVVISGNKRLRCLKAAFGEDGECPAEWFADVTAMSEAERHEFIVSANVSDGSWDLDKLLAQYDRAELEELMGGEAVEELLAGVELPEGVEEDSEATTDLEAADGGELQLDARMEAAKYVFFAFSGGRDSTRAIYLCARRFLATGKRCEALYVESPCEYPDLIMHVRKVCKEVGLPLKCLHPDRTYLTEFVDKGKAPDSIFMPCVEELINRNTDAYCASVAGDEDYILVRGGQAKQKTSRSKTAELHNPKTKPHLLIYNPLFAATPEQLSVQLPEWPGYAAGFKRTACWCCPFQTGEQFEALRKNYPLLFEELKKIMGSITFKLHEGDWSNCRKYLWWEREGVKIHFEPEPTEEQWKKIRRN